MATALQMLRRLTFLLVAFTVGCGGDSITSPTPVSLTDGRWTGDGACLAISGATCNLAVGCGHGIFPKPGIRTDGTFDVDGTYRIEVGPISIDPPPPAHFSGTLAGSKLTLHVVPTSGPSATYTLVPSPNGQCPVPCL